MHKRNVHRNTDSTRRTARVSQVRLEEISGKIEREKHKIIRTSHHEKAKVLNELKSIHRVFEPRLDVIKEIQERLLAENLSSVSKDDTAQNGRNGEGDKRDNTDLAEFVEQPKSLRRPETQSATPTTRRRHTEPKMWRQFGDRMPALPQSSSQADLENPPLSARQRSYRWCQPPNNEPEQPRLSVQVEREYLAKLRNAAEKPCVSDSMSSVSMGYIAFKRALKDKRRSERLDRKFVDPRFKSVFLDAAELSVIPEHTDWTSENNDYANPHLVKKDNRDCSGRLPTPISKQHSLSSLALDGLPMRWPEARSRLLKPDLLSAKSTEVTALKSGRCIKTNKASGTNIRERSIEREEEEIFGTFDENQKKRPFRATGMLDFAAVLRL